MFIQEFMDFLKKYGIIGLTIAVIISGAAGKQVTALVKYLLMSIVTVVILGSDWRTIVTYIGPIKFLFGDFLGALVDFVISPYSLLPDEAAVEYRSKGGSGKVVKPPSTPLSPYEYL